MDVILDIVFEIIFDLFIEGSIEASMSSKVPLFWRIAALTAVILVYGLLLYVIISLAIEERSIIIGILALIVIVMITLAAIKKFREYKKRREQ
ncbi:MAG: hypothetical protein II161_07980 [Erysipelotrichaceae bacterium]|nr:hypothetical protein [Erysipelotrichaceae bacterium]